MKQQFRKPRIQTTFFMILLLLTATSSCEKDWPDEYCDCNHGGNTIDGWEDAGDSTIVNKKDTVGCFDISVDEWGDTITHDIHF